jgi:heptosyltransferase-2
MIGWTAWRIRSKHWWLCARNNDVKKFEPRIRLSTEKLKILLRVPNWLGDSLMATPAVIRAREIYPKAHLTVMARLAFADFWKSFPGVDSVFTLDSKGRHAGLWGFWKSARELKKEKFDIALTLPLSFSSAFLFFAADIPKRIGYASEGRSFFLTRAVALERARRTHLVQEYLRLVEKGFDAQRSQAKRALLASTQPGNSEVAALIRRHRLSPTGWIALGPGATYGPAKRWPLPYWKLVIQKLLNNRSEDLLVLGGQEEADYLKPLVKDFKNGAFGKRVHLMAGETSVSGLAALLSKCKLLITNDTGPMHVAAAVGTPTVALFGSTSPAWTRPFGLGHEVLYHQTECSPCFQKTCPIGYICLHRIKVEEVMRSVRKILIRKPGSNLNP